MASVRPLEVEDLTVSIGSVELVSRVSFQVERGMVTALFGPSGAGKTSTLLALAGLHGSGATVTGRISLEGRDISITAPEDRSRLGISIVLQNLGLFPHLTTLENVEYPLRRRGISKREARERSLTSLSSLEISELAHRRIPTLSGGQAQRVALARAMVSSPSVLLLDEPLKGLQPQLKDRFLALLRRIALDGLAVVLVSHDRRDIDLVADVVLAMNAGRITSVEPRRDPGQDAPFLATEPLTDLRLDDGSKIEVPASSVRISVSRPAATPFGSRAIPASILEARALSHERTALLIRQINGHVTWLDIAAGRVHGDLIPGQSIWVSLSPPALGRERRAEEEQCSERSGLLSSPSA